MLGEGPTLLGPDSREKRSSAGLDSRSLGGVGAGTAGPTGLSAGTAVGSGAPGVLADGCCRGNPRRFLRMVESVLVPCRVGPPEAPGAWATWLRSGPWHSWRAVFGAFALLSRSHLPRRPDCLCPTRCFVLLVSPGTAAGHALASQCAWGARACPQGLWAMGPEASLQGLSVGHAHCLITSSRGRESRALRDNSFFFAFLEATHNLYSNLQISSAERKPVPRATPGSRIPQGE